MSGSDNLKGFDYQITFSLLKVLQLLAADDIDSLIQFESLNEAEEDFNIFTAKRVEFYQLKKRNEGDHWTPVDLKAIFTSFIAKDAQNHFFFFVTDGTANPDVKALKKFLLGTLELSNEDLNKFKPTGNSITQFKALLSRTAIETRFAQSGDDSDPAALLRESVKKLLFASPFHLSHSIDESYSAAWKLVYDYSRACQKLKLQTIQMDLEKVGIFFDQREAWLKFPDIKHFSGRNEELKVIRKKIAETGKLFLYGINGIGKSWLVSKLVQETKHKSGLLCWVSVSRIFSSDDLRFLLTHCLHSNNESIAAAHISEANEGELIGAIVTVLKKIEIVLVFDSVNSGNMKFLDFVKDFVNKTIKEPLSGKLIISSTERLFDYGNTELRNKNVSEFDLKGFSETDFRLVVADIQWLTNDEASEIYRALGGHPMSVYFLRGLLSERQITQEDFQTIKNQTIEEARDWIIKRCISQLSAEEQSLLLTLSVAEGNISFQEVDLLLKPKMRPRYLLQRHSQLGLLKVTIDNVQIHDAIRNVAFHMLSRSAITEGYQQLKEFYFQKMNAEKETEEGVLYETIFKWGFYLEMLYLLGVVEPNFQKVFDLEPEQHDALWAIQRFGYPFDYKTENLSDAKRIVKTLQQKKLIKRYNGTFRTQDGRKPAYELINMGYWEMCFVEYYLQTRGISNHLGYIKRFSPNHAYYKQIHVICPWEHCVEHMPLPPYSQEDEQEALDAMKATLDSEEFRSEEEKEKLILRIKQGVNPKLPRWRNQEMDEKRCPIFGHCCPGGKEQAQICQAEG